LIRRGKQGIDICTRQKVDESAVEAFAGNGKHPVDLSGMGRCHEGHVMKEVVNRREAKIANANA
jgi:hypothetical protein